MGEAGYFALFLGSAIACASFCGLRAWQGWLNSRNTHQDTNLVESIEELRRDIHDLVAQQDDRNEEIQSRIDFVERVLANPVNKPAAGSEPLLRTKRMHS